MNRGASFLSVLALATVPLTACHTMRFDVVPDRADHVVYDRKSYFLFGLLPTQEVDVGRICPYGVAAIREQTSFTDGLFAIPFLGLWEFRSSWYYCLPEKAEAPTT